jgi:hypothetical protein
MGALSTSSRCPGTALLPNSAPRKNTIVDALVPVLPRWRLAVQAGDGPLPASAIAYEMWLPHKVIV